MPQPSRTALAVAAALLAVSCSAPPESPRAAATPVPPTPPTAPLAVHVTVAEGASPDTAAWARALEEAVAAHPDLEPAKGDDAAGLVVRISSVEPAPKGAEIPGDGEPFVMRFQLVVDGATNELHLSYRGEARPQAEALARNLRQIGVEAKERAAAAPTPATDSAP